MKRIVFATAAALVLPLTMAAGCDKSPTGSAPPTYHSIYETVSATPAATNPGVGHVSGACRFSIKGPAADDTGGSGLKPRRMSSGLVVVAGIVWGYCTDVIHHFTLDMHIYVAPAGDAHGDFTKDSAAHEISSKAWHTPPGPAPVPYPITGPCSPNLKYQLVWYQTGTDDAGNFIGGGPYGGQIVSFTAAQCGVPVK